jgi:hypothetical protein
LPDWNTLTGQQDIELEKGDFLNRFPCFGHIRGFGGGACGKVMQFF